MILPEEMERIEFLRKLGEPHLHKIAAIARLAECLQGTILFREGQESAFIYFLLSGNVALEVEEPDGESVDVYSAGPGEMLGWSPVLGQHAMTATARALTRCRLAVLDVSRLQALCDADPRFAIAFFRQVGVCIAERLASTRRHLAVARVVNCRSPFLVQQENV